MKLVPLDRTAISYFRSGVIGRKLVRVSYRVFTTESGEPLLNQRKACVYGLPSLTLELDDQSVMSLTWYMGERGQALAVPGYAACYVGLASVLVDATRHDLWSDIVNGVVVSVDGLELSTDFESEGLFQAVRISTSSGSVVVALADWSSGVFESMPDELLVVRDSEADRLLAAIG